MKGFRCARKTVDVSIGESVRIIRELQGHSQNQLSAKTGIRQATISAIENDRVRLGVDRAKVIADVNFRGTHQKTALMYPAGGGYLDTVKALLARGQISMLETRRDSRL